MISFSFYAFRIFSRGIVPPYRTTTGPTSHRGVGIGPYGPEAEFLTPYTLRYVTCAQRLDL